MAQKITKRASIFEKLAIKDKVAASKTRQSFLLVEDEIRKNTELKEQLEQLLDQNNQKNESQSAQTLLSASWMNTKIRDQLDMLAERNTQLEKERDRLQDELMKTERKRTRKLERAEDLHRLARKMRQDKADQAISELGGRRG